MSGSSDGNLGWQKLGLPPGKGICGKETHGSRGNRNYTEIVQSRTEPHSRWNVTRILKAPTPSQT